MRRLFNAACSLVGVDVDEVGWPEVASGAAPSTGLVLLLFIVLGFVVVGGLDLL